MKASIRSRKKGWFDPKNGARGWIVGPFICLWFSVFDRYGPMLFGKISSDEQGTRITGRAGSDLNGIALFTILLPVLVLITYQMISTGQYTPNQLIIIGIFLLLSPLMFWWSHKERREAEPLVRFLRDAVSTPGRALRTRSAAVDLSKAFNLYIDGEIHEGSVTPDAIHNALLEVGSGRFVVLESGPETYIQTASRDGGYVLEMREGDGERHSRAMRRSTSSMTIDQPTTILTFEQVREAFIAYASETPMPHFLTWERMHLAN